MIGDLLCSLRIHAWRNVTRQNAGLFGRVDVCRRGCGARRVNGERE